MRPLLAGLALILAPGASAQSPLPADWQPFGPDTATYHLSIDTVIVHAGHQSLRIDAPANASENMWAGAIQIVSPAPFRGHRVRLSAAGRTDNVGAAGIWLRVEGQLNGAPAILAFDNMLGGERAVTGTTGWLTYEVVLDVPLDATALAFGPLMAGGGRFWVDQLRFEEVAASVPATNILPEPQVAPNSAAWANRRTVPVPTNLDFEQ